MMGQPQTTAGWREYWDSHGPVSRYEATEIHGFLLKEFPERKKTVLDLACGTGFFSWELVVKGFPTVSVDFSSEVITGHKGIVPFIQADMIALPFKLLSFDILVCLRSMPYLSSLLEVRAFLEEIDRVTKELMILSFSDKWKFKFDDINIVLVGFGWNCVSKGTKEEASDSRLYIFRRAGNGLGNAGRGTGMPR